MNDFIQLILEAFSQSFWYLLDVWAAYLAQIPLVK